MSERASVDRPLSEQIGKYLSVRRLPIEEGGKTYCFVVCNGATELGFISYWPAWRQYVFCPHPQTLFSLDCLADLASFLLSIKNLRAPA